MATLYVWDDDDDEDGASCIEILLGVLVPLAAPAVWEVGVECPPMPGADRLEERTRRGETIDGSGYDVTCEDEAILEAMRRRFPRVVVP